MESLGRQAGEKESFVRTPEFEPLKGLRSPESEKHNILHYQKLNKVNDPNKRECLYRNTNNHKVM
mgnify:CR=1 FL=1